MLGGAPIRPAPVGKTQDTDRFERALMLMPAATAIDALPFYDAGERASFARSRWTGSHPGDGDEAALRPPFAVNAYHEAGIVLVRWEADPATLALSEVLPEGQRLGWRVYRGLNLDPPALVAELDLEQRRWRDQQLPLSHSLLAYQVWAVVIDGSGALIAAEPSEQVTVELAERFELQLVEGDEQSAVFRIHLAGSTQPLTQPPLRVAPGQLLATGGWDTGLTLKDLTITQAEQLRTRRRFDFRADGSLVLDPTTNTPRRTETQVLVSVRRLIATLSDPLGVPRTLELDLP